MIIIPHLRMKYHTKNQDHRIQYSKEESSISNVRSMEWTEKSQNSWWDVYMCHEASDTAGKLEAKLDKQIPIKNST